MKPAACRVNSVGAEVAGEDEDGLAGVGGALLQVGEQPAVEHAEQDVQDAAVGLLDLVEQHDAAAVVLGDLGGEQAFVVVVADVGRWGAEQGVDGVPVVHGAAVDADHARRGRRSRWRRSPRLCGSCRCRAGRRTASLARGPVRRSPRAANVSRSPMLRTAWGWSTIWSASRSANRVAGWGPGVLPAGMPRWGSVGTSAGVTRRSGRSAAREQA